MSDPPSMSIKVSLIGFWNSGLQVFLSC